MRASYFSIFLMLTSVLLSPALGPALPLRTTSAATSPSPDFTIRVSPNNITIGHTPGYGVQIIVTSINNFAGPVTLSSTRPGGLAAGPGPTSVSLLPNGTATSVLFFDTDFVQPGNYLVNVTGTSVALTHWTPFDINLVGPDFQMRASKDVVAVVPGVTLTNAAQIMINVIDNLTGPVQIYAYEQGGGFLIGTLGPSTLTVSSNRTSTSQLSIYGSQGNVNPGTYNLVVSASYQNSSYFTITHIITIQVIVEQAIMTQPGIQVGNTATYDDVSVQWSSNPSGIPPTPPFSNYTNAYSIKLQLTAVQDPNATALETVNYANATAQSKILTGNLLDANGTIFPWVIRSGANPGFNQTRNGYFAGSPREVGILNVTSVSGPATAKLGLVWDVATGLLLEETLSVQAAELSVSIDGTLQIKVTETNVWTPVLSDFSITANPARILAGGTSVPVVITSLNNFSGTLSFNATNISSASATVGPQHQSLILSANGTVTVLVAIGEPTPALLEILITVANGTIIHKAVLTVNVVPLFINASEPYPNPVTTGETVTVTFSVVPPSPVSRITVNWGDGTSDILSNTATSDSHIYLTSLYQRSHLYTVNITATNNSGVGFATTTVNVTDRPPVLSGTSLSPDPAGQGQRVNLNFMVIESNGTVATTWVDWGDGSSPDLLMVMTSGSMCQRLANANSNACTIPIGDLLLFQPQNPSSITDGTIVAFRFPTNPTFIIIHRVVIVYTPNNDTQFPGQYAFATHGDANPPGLNEGPIPASDVLGTLQSDHGPLFYPWVQRYDSHTYPIHTISQPETYTITMNATDDVGLTTQLTATETINHLPPVIMITSVSPSQNLAGAALTLNFTSTDSDGTVASITINWGDGVITNDLPPTTTSQSHVYTTPGTFTISITATDSTGDTSQAATRTLVIDAQPSQAAPTILGASPPLFYSIIALVAVILGTVAVLALRNRRKI